MLDFRLNSFLTLCQVLNYTKTAEILHITQPAVSQHIRYLEEYYGVKLFLYKGKNLRLTDAGKKLYSFATAMKTSSDKLKTTLKLAEEESSPLKFGTTLTIGEYTMTYVLRKLLSDFPQLSISMEVGNTELLLHKLKEGEIDFALLEGHFDKSQYQAILLSLENFIGICSNNHPFNNRRVNFDEILNERLILREEGSGTRNIFEQILYEHNYTMEAFKQVVEIGNMETIKSLVKENLGISFMYEAAVKEELNEGSLVRIDLEDLQIKREFNFVFLKDSLHAQEYLKWFKYFDSKLK